MPQKVLVARVDRIGDLILTLPMEHALKGTDVYWLVEKNLRFVMEATEAKDRVFYVDGKHAGIAPVMRWLRQQKFDVVYAVHVPWWLALCFWMARIPLRVGAASQWFSWLFFNRAIRQRRSQALKNEAQYNLELIESGAKLSPARLTPDSEVRSQWKARLGEGFVIIHPGMAGSARNWPLHKYAELADKLVKKGNRVIVTGSASDRSMVEASGILSVNGVEDYVDKTVGADLLSVLSLARAVVAPSTGVAHLAASLGTRVVGIYSPVRVQHPQRWGPVGQAVKVFVPEVACPGEMKCLGTSCRFYDCMEKIDVDSVVNSVMEP